MNVLVWRIVIVFFLFKMELKILRMVEWFLGFFILYVVRNIGYSRSLILEVGKLLV